MNVAKTVKQFAALLESLEVVKIDLQVVQKITPDLAASKTLAVEYLVSDMEVFFGDLKAYEALIGE